jgi:hypothetical protein
MQASEGRPSQNHRDRGESTRNENRPMRHIDIRPRTVQRLTLRRPCGRGGRPIGSGHSCSKATLVQDSGCTSAKRQFAASSCTKRCGRSGHVLRTDRRNLLEHNVSTLRRASATSTTTQRLPAETFEMIPESFIGMLGTDPVLVAGVLLGKRCRPVARQRISTI